MIVQKIKKDVADNMALAEKYYSILSDINSLNLTTREIQLIAFTAVRGNISNANVREEFCTKHNTTNPTINNIISKLKKVGVFVKEKNMVKVNPSIVLDFNKDVLLAIKLQHEQTS